MKPEHEVYFGDKSRVVMPDDIRAQVFEVPENISVSQIIFQHQVHGTHGHVITRENSDQFTKSLTHDGDYLITNVPKIGLSVLTADCLPIALADTKNKAVAMIHAGWRGSVGGIVRVALEHMHKLYGTEVADITVYFGPCAGSCCYQVDQKFVDQLPDWAHASIIEHDNKLFFDLVSCNIFLLHKLEITKKQINIGANKCTICNHNFCSYRRDSGSPARQMSIIWIN